MKKIVALSVFAGMTLTAGAAFADSVAVTPNTGAGTESPAPTEFPADRDASAESGKTPKGEFSKTKEALKHTPYVKMNGSLAATDKDCNTLAVTGGGVANAGGKGEAGAKAKCERDAKGNMKASSEAYTKVDTSGKKDKVPGKKGKLAKTGTPAVAASMASLLAVVTGAGVVAYRKFA